ncbi:hypothetical protein JTE90_020601 [Oedothorax gibbosus]|uniref:Uncharacterized protein n=1 Tax=Oedothorax gibbosus TaxID=931172 RepID=A0AAV6VX09_9ARAC|nr:hypothetical protein JTE90_020601 [Oedothorax gibbosus]
MISEIKGRSVGGTKQQFLPPQTENSARAPYGYPMDQYTRAPTRIDRKLAPVGDGEQNEVVFAICSR